MWSVFLDVDYSLDVELMFFVTLWILTDFSRIWTDDLGRDPIGRYEGPFGILGYSEMAHAIRTWNKQK